MTAKTKQLNPFELKSTVIELLNKLNSPADLENCLSDIELLDEQEDKNVISKILFKELVNAKPEKISIICFLLERYVPKEEFINKLWETLKNQNLDSEVKITILNLLRDFDSDWSYETCEQYLDDASALLDENTKQMLNSAIINPEIQIDFMDFMASIRVQDRIALLNSFSEDFTSDVLANILIPVFVSDPNSAVGIHALKLLGETKSQLALNVLEQMQKSVHGELAQGIRKSLSTLKISGMREDNTKEFYKKILSNSKPNKFYITYPDGIGNQAMIFTRLTEDNRIRFVSVVINIETGIKDCFGFFDISEFECSKILERFLRDEKTVDINPESFKTILYNAEMQIIKASNGDWKLPYEYVCWKNLLLDIESDEQMIENILKEQVIPDKVDNSIIEKLTKLKVSTRWFLDYQYSDEFEEALEKLKGETNLDDFIENNLEKVFYPEEKQGWIQKLIMCAYIKFAIGKDDEAQKIYGLSQDNKILNELFKDILKRSIYEYLLLIKYDKNINSNGLEPDEIDEKIKYIEQKWVKNV